MDEDFEILDENNSNLNMNNSMPNKQNKEKITKKNNNISTKTSSTNKENTNVFKNNKTNGISRIKNAVNKNMNLSTAGKTAKLAGKGVKTAGTGVKAAGKAVNAGTNVAGSALSAIPVVGGALGMGVKTAGKAADAGMQVAGTGMQKAGDGLESASNKMKKNPSNNSKNKTEETVNKVAKGTIKAAKTTTKLLIIFWPITLGLAIALFVIYLIIGPLADAWSSIDKGARDVANTVEKMTNFYRGFGFQDSKQAFFEEIDDLQEFYDDSLDLPLLLSSIFYPETMGYDTSYQDHMEVINSDPVTEAFDGGLDSLFSYFGSWAKDILKEAGNTYDDETQLTYNAGKIYRLRRLAAAMCDRSGTPQSMTLGQFMTKLGKLLGKTMENLLSSLANATLGTIWNVIKGIFQLITLQFDDLLETAQEEAELFNNIGSALKQIFSVLSFGLFTITSIHPTFGDGGLTLEINYIPYKVNQDKYDAYLKDYYFEDTPEFYRLLPKEETLRNQKKAVMVSEIYEQRNLFKDIFLQYEDGEVEAYANNCVGALNNGLIKNLRLPVDIPDGYNVDFGDRGFGMGVHPTTGVNQMHNGVDINGYSAGVHEGDNVYAVAPGKVISSDPTMQTSESKWAGAWVRIEHTIDIDGKEYKFISVYMHLQTNSGQPAVGSSVSKGQVIGKIGTTGDSTGPHLHFEIREPDGSTYGNAIDPTNLFKPCPSTELVGADNQEKIWNYLVGKGYTKIASISALANFQKESHCDPASVEGNYLSGYPGPSVLDTTESRNNYTVNFLFPAYARSGISICESCYKGEDGNYYPGVGLPGFTGSNSFNLFTKAKNDNILWSDLLFQLEFFMNDYSQSCIDTFSGSINTTSDVNTATRSFALACENGNMPESDIIARQEIARQLYEKYSNR